MDVVELFAGIGGFRIAADRVGLRTVWANDVCPDAAEVYDRQFGEGVMHEGKIEKLWEDVPEHDFLTGGFPCQPFSKGGKKKGIKDPRGTLFEVVAKIIDRRRPKYFVLENVRNLLSLDEGMHFATILSRLTELPYVVDWRVLNASWFGLPQNRDRIIIAGRRFDVAHPRLLAGELPTRMANGDERTKAGLTVEELLKTGDRWQSISDHGAKFPLWGVACRERFAASSIATAFPDAGPLVRVKDRLCEDVAIGLDFTDSTLRRIVNSDPVNRFINGVEVLYNQKKGARQGYTIYGVNGLAPTLTANPSRRNERYFVDGTYRRLSDVEYARFQGFPDDHCSYMPGSRPYRLAGNAVPPPMVEWAIRRLLA